MKTWRKMLSLLLCLVMTATMLPGLALAEESAAVVEQDSSFEEQSAEEAYLEPESPEPVDVEESILQDEEPAAAADRETEIAVPEEESALPDTDEAICAEENTALTEFVSEAAGTEDAADPQNENKEEVLLEADSDEEYESCGENLTWEIDYYGKLTISGTGSMFDCTATLNADGRIQDCSSVFYSYRDEILTVAVEEGVTGIGDYAFAGCTKLSRVTVPASLNVIGTSAFQDCTGLTTVEFPEGMKMERIGAGAFSGCSDLSSIELPAGITKIETKLFYGCSSLPWISIPDGTTVIEDAAFSGCGNLSFPTIAGSVTRIGNSAFYGCDDLREVYFDGSKEEWVKVSIGSNNESLTEVWIHYLKPRGHCGDNLSWIVDDEGVLTITGSGAMYDFSEENLPPWMGESDIEVKSVTFGPGITSIGTWAFYHQGLTGTLTIPDGVTKIGEQAFIGCRTLEGVTFPSSLTRIEAEAFCFSGLTSVTIPASVTFIGESAFCECESLTGITVDSGNAVYASQDGVLFNRKKTQLLCYPSGKAGSDYTIPASVTSIGSFGFYCCDNLTSVKIPDSVTSIGEAAFSYSTNLESVNIPAGITYLGNGAFERCALTSVTIPRGITAIGNNTFDGCRLTTVTIPENIKSIGEWAFCNCKQLTDVTISEGVESIGYYAFAYCSVLSGVTFPASLKTIGDRVIQDCSRLKTITFLGSAPSSGGGTFFNITATAYYPKDDSSWTEEVRKSFGGTITWIGQGETWIYIDGKKSIRMNKSIEDCVFSTSSTTYNEELAYYLMGLSTAVYKENDIRQSLKSLGFESANILTSSDYQSGIFNDRYAAYTLAKKQLENGTTLVMIVARGSTGLKEWILTDFNPGTTMTSEVGLHSGFMSSVYRLYDDLKDFLGGSIQTGNITYVLTGHSLGAATANLVAVKLLAELVPTSKVYDYNFACPDVGKSTYSLTRWEEEYPNIFNIADARDPVSVVPGVLGRIFASGRWFKFGKSRWFSSDWTNPNCVNLTAGAHFSSNYVSKLSSKPSYSQFYDRFRAAAARTETVPNPRYLLFGAKCPVDIVVYDSNGTAIAGVTNGVPNYYDSEFGEVFIATMGDEKAIALPEGEDYTVQLTGTESGEMEFDVILTDVVSQEFVEEKTFETVALEPGKEFVSMVNVETEVPEVKLYVVDENDTPIQEVQEDGTEVDLPAGADKTQLRAAVAYAEGLAETDYTAESWAAMQTALTAAKKALTKVDAAQDEVDAATADLDNAVATLQPAVPAEVDKSQLQAAIDYAEGLNEADYTADSWAAVKTALTAAKTVLAKADAAQEEVDAATADLDNAVAALEGKQPEQFRFTDVADPSAYYYNPVYWAADNGITSGTSPTTFSPGKSCTRGQIVTFLWKAMGSPEPSSTNNPFTDVKPTDYFYKPVLWAKENGITSGKTATTFEPGSPCTRGQIVTFLWIAKGRPEPSSTENPFTDVKTTDYFFKPVLWAKENGITSGTSATSFSPGNTCTRAQAMTFLWIASGRP